MILKEIGIVLGILLILVIFANIWFNIIENILNKIKSKFEKNTNIWHEFPEANKNRKKLVINLTAHN